jgi:TRAP-type mannitol/chloroaromatic compound transport system substrate-binding protein
MTGFSYFFPAKNHFMKKISRKRILQGIALGTISLPLFLRGLLHENRAQGGGSNTFSSRTYEWKMVTTWPPNFPVIGETCQLFADLCESMSGGRIKIRVYGAGELVPALECFDAVRTGAAEVSSGAAYYWAGKAAAAQFFATVPFGMNAQQVNAWLLAGGGLELWQELYADFGLVPFPGGNTGVQMGGWFNREVNTLNDLKGLKMRIPGLGGKVLEKAGGSPVLLAGGEIYTGLERGVIDATEWLGPFHDRLMGFHEIAKYYYTPGWHEPGTVLELFLNQKAYDSLSPDLQAIVRAAALYSNQWCLAQMEARNAEAFAQLLTEGVDVRTYSQDILTQLYQYNQEAVRELADSTPFATRVFDSYSAFRQKAVDYAAITEKAYYEQIQGLS